MNAFKIFCLALKLNKKYFFHISTNNNCITFFDMQFSIKNLILGVGGVISVYVGGVIWAGYKLNVTTVPQGINLLQPVLDENVPQRTMEDVINNYKTLKVMVAIVWPYYVFKNWEFPEDDATDFTVLSPEDLAIIINRTREATVLLEQLRR
jgi:hypothetical protein